MSSMAALLLNKVVMLVCISMVTLNVVFAEAAGLKSNLSRRKLEVQKHFDKSPVKTIKFLVDTNGVVIGFYHNLFQSPDGDIIDCFHIAHQPSLNHPLLKNHTIQMKPSNYPEGVFLENKVHAKGTKTITQLWHLNGRCPRGTIPIRRTKRDNILKASSLRTFRRRKHKAIPQSISMFQKDMQVAIAYLEKQKHYKGAEATMNVWKPKVEQPDEYSSSTIYMSGGDDEFFNIIEAGWQVFPALYNDNNTRFFGYWFNGKPKNPGCHNLLCDGFVQTSNTIVIGGTIYPLSTYGGSQYEISVSIWKDKKLGHWWLGFGRGIMVGYWPDELLPDLAHGASIIQWGGEITNSKIRAQHTTTQMGSGHFPQEKFGKASYFKNFRFLDDSYFFQIPKDIETFSDHPTCYNIQNGTLKTRELYFFYGGSGRNPNCP